MGSIVILRILYISISVVVQADCINNVGKTGSYFTNSNSWTGPIIAEKPPAEPIYIGVKRLFDLTTRRVINGILHKIRLPDNVVNDMNIAIKSPKNDLGLAQENIQLHLNMATPDPTVEPTKEQMPNELLPFYLDKDKFRKNAKSNPYISEEWDENQINENSKIKPFASERYVESRIKENVTPFTHISEHLGKDRIKENGKSNPNTSEELESEKTVFYNFKIGKIPKDAKEPSMRQG